jgi:hypothetical protein
MGRADAAPEGYFLIPRMLAYALTMLAAYIAVALTVLAIGVWVGLGTDDHQRDQLRELTIQNRRALCGLRADLHQRVTAGEAFLTEHPEGLPKINVSAAVLRENITNQKRTIHTLGVLTCSPDHRRGR